VDKAEDSGMFRGAFLAKLREEFLAHDSCSRKDRKVLVEPPVSVGF
jgi:hypothetical protein